MESVPKFGDRSPPRNGWGLSEVWADNVDHVSRRSQMIIQVVAGDAAFFYRGAHFVRERGQIQPFVDCPRAPPPRLAGGSAASRVGLRSFGLH